MTFARASQTIDHFSYSDEDVRNAPEAVLVVTHVTPLGHSRELLRTTFGVCFKRLHGRYDLIVTHLPPGRSMRVGDYVITGPTDSDGVAAHVIPPNKLKSYCGP